MSANGIEVDLQITNRCPLTCDHCVYSSSMTEAEGLPSGILPRLIAECAELGVSQVSITGGEPFLRDDLEQVVSLIAAHGIEVCVQTSGVMVDRIDFGQLRASGLDLLLVSLDGPPEYHDRFRHRHGLFGQAVDTIERAVAEGIPVRVNTVVTRSNASRAVDLLPIAEALGVDLFSFFYFSPLGRGAHHESESLSFTEWRAVETAVRGWCVERGGRHRMGVKVQNVTVPLDGVPAGGQRCRISDRDNILLLANGDVFPCVFVCHQPHLRLGNVLDQSLARLWREADAWSVAYEPFFGSTGRDCADRPANHCSGGCPALRSVLRRPQGHCDRRCEHASSGLAPGCAREYTRMG